MSEEFWFVGIGAVRDVGAALDLACGSARKLWLAFRLELDLCYVII